MMMIMICTVIMTFISGEGNLKKDFLHIGLVSNQIWLRYFCFFFRDFSSLFPFFCRVKNDEESVLTDFIIRPDMHRSTVVVNQVPTEIITCGRWIEEGLANDGKRDIVIVITGNPGIPAFYEEFIETVNSKLPTEVPVWVIGHAGHTRPPDNALLDVPDTRNHRNLYDLKGQLDHKVKHFHSTGKI